MKYIILTLVPTPRESCQRPGKTETANDTASSLAPVGGAKDNHGCLISAGYIWSKIKEGCIRPWEGAMTMNITGTSTNCETAAFVLLDATKQQAELFIKEED